MSVETFYKKPLVAAIALALSVPTISQDLESDAALDDLFEELIVTARKREESLLKVPVSLTALTSDAIEKRGLISIEGLEDTSPGLTISDNSAGKTDRSVQTITMRGFSPTGGTDATVSLFIDGVPVSSTTALTSIGSPERIEILRGPQSAYFGRNTFAGAVNVVNKTPGDELAGSIELQIGDYGFTRYRGEIESPIVEDMLSFRVSGETYERDGQYDNPGVPGQRLGDQSSDMLNALFIFTPTEDLEFKLFGLATRDDDGPAESALISAVDIVDFGGNTVVQGQSNCLLNETVPYFCGEIPDKVDPPSYNTLNSEDIRTFLSDATGRAIDNDRLSGYGLDREYNHAHLTAKYDFGDSGFSLSYLGGFNKEEWVILNDIDHFAMDGFQYGFFVERIQEDESHEVRIDYDNGGALRGILGFSVLDAERVTGNTAVVQFFGSPPPTSVTPPTSQETETTGIFFGVTYDINDMFSVSLEGRQQEDSITPFDAAGQEIISEDFTNFLPRAIVNAQINEDTMLFASFAQGVNPGAFNNRVLDLNAEDAAAAADLGLTLVVEPEEVDNFEIGAKGTAFEKRLTYAAAAYYANWGNQHNRINIALSGNGESGPQFLSGIANSGEVDLYGLELEGSLSISDSLTLDFSGAYIDSKIKEYTNVLLTSLTGISDFNGKEQPFVSKYSANLGLQYQSDEDLPWFARADVIYKSGQWLNQANHAESSDIIRMNLRAGLTAGPVDFQLYVNNVFDNDEYTSVYDYFAFAPSFAFFGNHSAVVAGLPEKRNYGIQAKFNF